MVGDFVRRRNRNKVKVYIFLVLLVVVSFISIGYAYLSRDLSMAIDVKIKPSNLYNKIIKYAVMDNKKSKYVTSSTGIDFSQISSDVNGKGIYMLSSTKNDDYPIYYYRGAVENNNVLFAGFCWKIVRTTETGGIKLIYNGVPDSNGACNNTGTSSQIGTSSFNTKSDDNAYVGYMYGTPGSSTYEETHKNTNDSAIKIYIDNWYKNNMTDYTSMLEDTVWCNDRSVVTNSNWNGDGTGTTKTKYGAAHRVGLNKTPNLECENLNDRFTVSASNGNGALIYPVAMLTADETAYAGDVYNIENSTYYLHTGQEYWYLSPTVFSGVAFNFSYNYYENVRMLLNCRVIQSLGVRPSISLKSGTKITGGDGSAKSPYVVYVVDNRVCRRATVLHTEECIKSDDYEDYCDADGYTSTGSKKTTTITYGNLGVKGTLKSGDAFDCDVNGDGVYDSNNERFYYITDLDTNSNYAVLLSANNVAGGVVNNEKETQYYVRSSSGVYKAPSTAVLELPSVDSWSRVSLYNTTRDIKDEKGTVKVSDFSYQNYAARLITVQEISKACSITVGNEVVGELSGCNYLLENTAYSNPDSSINGGYWTESYDSVGTGMNINVFVIAPYHRYLQKVGYSSSYGVRPAIEVLKSNIAY